MIFVIVVVIIIIIMTQTLVVIVTLRVHSCGAVYCNRSCLCVPR